jgi:CRISPR/Cas system-associated endoribonuclease Cas2
MKIKNELLNILNTKIGRYKGMDVNILGLPILKDKNPRSIKNAFYSLCRDGLVKTEDKNIILTKKGRSYLKNKVLPENIFNFSFPDNSPKNLLVMYDIQEDKKSEREWFRRHLRKFGYVMVQRSVWVGPSPLPKDFLDYVKKIRLKENLKTFKLAKDYKI